MYINDVIRRVRDYMPNEYSDAELYTFCDEVSAMIAIEDKPVYKERIIPIANDGTILLPEGVRFENVERVISGGVELNKEDMRTYGKRTVKVRGANDKIVYVTGLPYSSATVVYIAPYSPIRLPKYIGKVTIDKENGKLYIDNCDFIPGDSLVLDIDGTQTPGIMLLDIAYDADNNRFELTTVPDVLSEVAETEAETATLTRTITEETLCDAPYDSMYVDYILAKISLYQGNATVHNQHMALFNSRLTAYKEWLIQRLPYVRHSFRNWW